MSKAADPTPEFSRPLRLSRQNRNAPLPFEAVATNDEMEKLVDLLDLLSLRKLRFDGALTAVDGGGWHLKGMLGATVSQACVVTLAPVQTRVDRPVTRLYLPGGELSITGAELDLDPEDDDTIETLTDQIDLGLIATEELALALPPYPRAKGVPEAAEPTPEPGESRQKPFAGLAELRKKMENGGE